MYLINGSLLMLCSVFSLLLIIALGISPQWRRSPSAKPALLMMFFVFVMLVTAGVAYLFLPEKRGMLNVFATVNYVSSFFAEWFFSLFIISQVNVSASMKRSILSVIGVFCITGSTLFIINSIHPFFYDFRTMQYLHPAVYWGFSILNYAFFCFSGLLLLFRGGRNSMKERIFPVITQFLPLTSFLFDLLIPGLYSWDILVFVAIGANYIHLMFVMAESAQEKIDQLELKRIRATLERIKPHYIYNVLASIYYLCDQDVGTAKEAICIFSDYLRDVLNMMEEHTLIPMSRELRAVRNYLELEQMRFGDRIRVRYQIEADQFLLPPFALQPLVENSVKHGAENVENGGEIVVSSYEQPDSYVVAVRDNFGGFDVGNPDNCGSGTKYVREILAMTVSGTLQISSKPGEGTVSMIVIPKKQ